MKMWALCTISWPEAHVLVVGGFILYLFNNLNSEQMHNRSGHPNSKLKKNIYYRDHNNVLISALWMPEQTEEEIIGDVRPPNHHGYFPQRSSKYSFPPIIRIGQESELLWTTEVHQQMWFLWKGERLSKGSVSDCRSDAGTGNKSHLGKDFWCSRYLVAHFSNMFAGRKPIDSVL